MLALIFCCMAFAENLKFEKDVKIPAVLVEEVQTLYKKVKSEDFDPDHSFVRRPLPFTFELVEKTEGILSSPKLELNSDGTGAVISLEEIVVPNRRGTFSMRFELHPVLAHESLPTTAAYFYSETTGKLLNLSSYFGNVLSKTGELINTADNSHLKILRGTFYFFVMDKEAARVGTLHIVK